MIVTRRDYFIGQALNGLVSKYGTDIELGNLVEESCNIGQAVEEEIFVRDNVWDQQFDENDPFVELGD